MQAAFTSSRREGREYAKAMTNCGPVDARPESKPSWKGRRLLQVLEVVEKVLADGEAMLRLVGRE